MKKCELEYKGQVVTGRITRSRWFFRRVRIDSTNGYFMAWVPKWKIHKPSPKEER